MNDLANCGETKYLQCGVSSGLFTSLDRIISIGWHCVNKLYKVERNEGARSNLLLFTLNGSGEVQINGKSYKAEPGTVIVIPMHHPHMYKTGPDSDWEFYWCHYYGDNSMRCTTDITRGQRHLFVFGTERISQIFDSFINNRRVKERREIFNSEWLRNILVLCLKKTVENNYSPLVLAVVRSIEENDFNRFSLDLLAEKLHYSKEHIVREFSRQTQTTPYHYWLLLQLERSCVELTQSELSIGEIANMYGLGTASNYSKQFSKYMKISPLEYRKMHVFVHN